MITYEYECQNEDCGLLLEIRQSIHDKALVKCPVCKKRKLERLIFPAYGFVRQDPTTIGQLAERNMKRMGKEGVEKARRKLKAEQEQSRQAALVELEKSLPAGAKIKPQQEHKPWYGKLPETLKEASSTKLNRYIREGKE